MMFASGFSFSIFQGWGCIVRIHSSSEYLLWAHQNYKVKDNLTMLFLTPVLYYIDFFSFRDLNTELNRKKKSTPSAVIQNRLEFLKWCTNGSDSAAVNPQMLLQPAKSYPK